MAAEGLRVKAWVFTERKIDNESMKDQAYLMLYGNWHRNMWLTVTATLLVGLATMLKYRGQRLWYWLRSIDSASSEHDSWRSGSSKGLLSHSSLESFARSNSSSNPPSLRRLKGASNWSELSRYAGLLKLDVHTGSRIEKTDLHICSKDGVPWVLGSGAYGIVYKAIRNGVQEVAIKILAAADDQQLHAFKKVPLRQQAQSCVCVAFSACLLSLLQLGRVIAAAGMLVGSCAAGGFKSNNIHSNVTFALPCEALTAPRCWSIFLLLSTSLL